MKPVRSLALLLLACALVGMGFFLPWLGAAWQDATMEQTTTQYEVTPLLDNDLSSHLKLVANGYTVFALSEASPRLSPAQTETAAVAALYDMDNLGLTFLGQDHLFSPDTWQFSSASPFVAMSSGSPDYAAVKVSPETALPLKDVQESDASPADTTVAVFWTCTFSNAENDGAELTLLLDDDTGKMLSFIYSVYSAPTVAIAFSMEDAQRMCDFCQAYYGTGAGGFEEPLALAPAGYLLPFVNAQGERITLSLSTDVHQDPNMSQDHFILAFNDLPSYDVSS